MGGRPAVGPKEMDGKLLGYNLCNKTDVDSIKSLPLVGPGAVVTGTSCCAPPRKVTSAKSLSGHPNICTMFPTMSAHMSAKVAAAQIMEADIALQETEEATRVERLQALQVKFSMAAQSKFSSKEKGVSWSPQESEFGPPLPGDSMAFNPPNPTNAVLVGEPNTGGPLTWTS
jgi:hypothetical protein